jgi:hypothetical protein
METAEFQSDTIRNDNKLTNIQAIQYRVAIRINSRFNGCREHGDPFRDSGMSKGPGNMISSCVGLRFVTENGCFRVIAWLTLESADLML